MGIIINPYTFGSPYFSRWVYGASKLTTINGADALTDVTNNGHELLLTKRNVAKNDSAYHYLDFSSAMNTSEHWAIEFTLGAFSLTSYSIFLGNSISNAEYISFKGVNSSDYFRCRNGIVGGVDGTVYHPSNLVAGDTLTIISNGTDVKFYVNGILVETITIRINWSPTRIGNYNNSSGGYGWVGEFYDIRFWKLDSYTDAQCNISTVNSLTPDYEFPCADVDTNLTYSSALVFRETHASGKTLTASTTGTTFASKVDAVSPNFEKGFGVQSADNYLYPRNYADTGYVGLTGAESGYAGYVAWNDQSEQAVKAKSGDTDFINKDTSNVFYSSGTPFDVVIADLVSNTYLKVNVSGNVISSIDILN